MDTQRCYDDLADHYHLIFEDWDASIVRQAAVLGPILESNCGPASELRVWDCACGIGTQALGLAKLGFNITASDLSPRAVDRLHREARQRGLNIPAQPADLLDLRHVSATFDAAICMDNALPHFDGDEQLGLALRQLRSKLRPGGLLIASIRDYDLALEDRPTVQGPSFYSDGSGKRIVFQLWEWLDDRRYVFHLYITEERASGSQTIHASATYRAIRRAELTSAFEQAGFRNVRWLLPPQSGFYQPIILATLSLDSI